MLIFFFFSSHITFRFDFTHKKQSGGHGQYGDVKIKFERSKKDFEFTEIIKTITNLYFICVDPVYSYPKWLIANVFLSLSKLQEVSII